MARRCCRERTGREDRDQYLAHQEKQWQGQVPGLVATRERDGAQML
jgi:hypothetical protein